MNGAGRFRRGKLPGTLPVAPNIQPSRWGKAENRPFFRLFPAVSGVPNGIRTRAAALKGRCPGPLDDGDSGNQGRLRVVSPVGIEPTTNWLKANCSTTELRARAAQNERSKYGAESLLSTAA